MTMLCSTLTLRRRNMLALLALQLACDTDGDDSRSDDASLSSADTEASEPSYASEPTIHAPITEETMTRTESDRVTPQPLDLKKAEETSTNNTRQGSPKPEEVLRKTPHETDTQTSSNGYNYSLVGTSVHQPPEGARDTPEDLSVTKDDDDDDDGDDDSDKLNETTPGVDPERLKAFNMFVRLFIDENLDRMVPISKQPKEKIQAIIEACYRQFPEFHERARKRIRTYLKSCRRMKRHRDQNGLDSVRNQNSMRPTPPHLTSARAEQILAAACESESENAKRLRMELMQAGHTNEVRMETSHQQPQQPTPPSRVTYEETPKHTSPRPVDYRYANGVSTHDPYYGSIAPHQPHNMIQPSQHAQMSNGPTDLSVKKLPSKAQLSPTEIANIRQLITSYRESAAFLYRSAEELEQMLLQLN
ncbi:nucleolar protein 4-like isoform X4 [Asterias rubens]|uniref:nucleolar protein 4-like isoform X4 n=1 Tax=Asterias rubens TaxID=7604 RepID=UPI0014554F2D|nr:nucleolar protein 4-like isoform X4 [Asterias rubens]